MATREKTRFETSFSSKQTEIFELAAQLGGYKTLSEFILSSAQQQADHILERHRQILANEEDRKIFFKALLHLPKPNTNLKRAMARYIAQHPKWNLWYSKVLIPPNWFIAQRRSFDFSLHTDHRVTGYYTLTPLTMQPKHIMHDMVSSDLKGVNECVWWWRRLGECLNKLRLSVKWKRWRLRLRRSMKVKSEKWKVKSEKWKVKKAKAEAKHVARP